MAENRRASTKNASLSPDEPLLRQGRPADPESEQEAETGEQSETAASESAEKKQRPSPEVDADSKGEPEPDIEKTLAESRQRKLRLLLKQCDRVMLMDFDILAMSDWPDNYSVAVARRNRDIWLLGCLSAALVFLSGMSGFVPAWIAGGGFGVFVILLLAGVPAVRGLIIRKPSYLDLIMQRRRMLRDARKHIAHLEGDDGLLWQCARLAEFNSVLRATRFSELRALSERRVLAKHLSRREHVRLYLIYMLEAEKAYSRAEKAFFEGHERALDEGWKSVVEVDQGEA